MSSNDSLESIYWFTVNILNSPGVKESLRLRRSASGEDLYRSLAEATGGTVYVTDKTAIHRVAAVIRVSLRMLYKVRYIRSPVIQIIASG